MLKTACVTGGMGFIGSHIVEFLVEKLDMKVYIIDDLSSGTLDNLPIDILEKITFLEWDIMNIDLFEDEFEGKTFDLIVHCAAQTDVRKSMEDPIEDACVNIFGGLEMLNLATIVNTKKFIFISTGGAMYSDENILPYSEESIVAPTCGYGISKLTFEKYLELYAPMHDIDYTILRLANVYGPRNKKGVISIFKKAMTSNESIVVNGGSQTRDYIHVSDVVGAVEAVLKNEEASNNLFNVGTGNETSLNKIVSLMEKEYSDWMGSIIRDKYKKGEVKKSCLNSRKLFKATGWSPKIPSVNIKES